jgi:putative endonuclease
MKDAERGTGQRRTRSRPAYTYMVECSDGTLYTGWTLNVEARVRVHNAGRGARYTRARRPVRLRYWERHANRAAAMRRERQIKTWPRKRKLALIAEFQERAHGGEERA